MQLELNDRERQELADLITATYSDLGAEIHHARDNDYRQALKDRRLVLEGLLKRLGVEMKIAA